MGLTVDGPDISTLYGYSYTELGYLTTAKCLYNDASQWQVVEEYCPDNTAYPCYYFVRMLFG